MKTMTVRNIPDEVAEVLSQRASDGRMSVNSFVVTFLSDAMLGGSPFSKKRALSMFCGTMSDEELAEFNAATEETRKIEPKDWE